MSTPLWFLLVAIALGMPTSGSYNLSESSLPFSYNIWVRRFQSKLGNFCSSFCIFTNQIKVSNMGWFGGPLLSAFISDGRITHHHPRTHNVRCPSPLTLLWGLFSQEFPIGSINYSYLLLFRSHRRQNHPSDICCPGFYSGVKSIMLYKDVRGPAGWEAFRLPTSLANLCKTSIQISTGIGLWVSWFP